MVVQRIKEHPECSLYFVVAPSGLAPETDWTWGSESSTETNIRENRIPLDLLGLGEAETVSLWFPLALWSHAFITNILHNKETKSITIVKIKLEPS